MFFGCLKNAELAVVASEIVVDDWLSGMLLP
jgi:hypothetical protein